MGTPLEIDQAFDELRRRSELFDEAFGHLDPSAPLGLREKAALLRAWSAAVSPARFVRQWVVETRAIPRGKAKAVELAFRAFETKRPRNVLKWWHKNRRHIETLIEAEGWPAREQQKVDVYDVGPLLVHDTIHMTESQLRRTLAVVDDATQALLDLQSPLSKVLYGDVFIVGKLRTPRTLAWYYPDEDRVYLRPQPGDTERETFNLLHELGHRYWCRFMAPDDQRQWKLRHEELWRHRVDVQMPRPGEQIPVGDGSVEILEIKYLPHLRDAQAIVKGGRIPVRSILRGREKAARAELFPTVYAMRDPEEHFADAFAMYVLGLLPQDHESFFQDWITAGRAMNLGLLKERLSGLWA